MQSIAQFKMSVIFVRIIFLSWKIQWVAAGGKTLFPAAF